MSQPAYSRAPRSATIAALIGGTSVSVACFALGFMLRLLVAEAGQPAQPGLVEVIAGALRLQGWAWSSLGVLAILVTPAVALVATGWELRRAGRSSARLAVGVLAVLAVATLASLLTR
ncbi:hypothetical protein BH24CHL5_BH24CHL5_07840 [soil metagenome]